MRMTKWRTAMLEGGAVLVGILLAFGIQAGWEVRQEAQRVDASLTSLALELDDNKARIERRLESIAAGIAETEAYLVELVADPRGAVSQDSIRDMIGAMGPLRVEPTSRAAFDDLVGGGLQAIDDGDLRRSILEYGQALEYHAERQRSAQVWFEARAQLYDELEGDLVGAISSRGWAGRTDLRFDVDPAAFVRNRRYANLLAARSNHLRNIRSSADFLSGKITELRRKIDER